MEIHRVGDQAPNLLGRLDQMTIGKMGIACRCPVPPMPKQLADQWQVLARHDRLTDCRMTLIPISE